MRGAALRYVLLAVLVLLIAPYVLAPFYAFGRPLSTVMLWRELTGQRVERDYVRCRAFRRGWRSPCLSPRTGASAPITASISPRCATAISEADDLEDMRGGSTITQQVAKNLFLWPGRSYIRKALEIPLALWIDLVLSKRRILEIYLNIAEWGPDGQFGVEAGARYAFGTSARDLSRYQAALLAAVLPNPADRNARKPGPGLRRLAGLYVARSARSPEADDCLEKSA